LNENDIPINSFVLLDMASISSEVRKKIKDGEYKSIQVRFSPILFEVIKKYNPKNGNSRPTYKVRNTVTKYVLPKRFYSNELQVVHNTTKDPNDSEKKQQRSMQRAYKLNGIKPQESDTRII
jgi:hypothetical protein